MVQDDTPPLDDLAHHGVARVSYGPGPYLLAMEALEARMQMLSEPKLRSV